MTEIKNNAYRPKCSDLSTRITQIKEKYPTSKEQLMKIDEYFLEIYSREFGINLEDPFISQKPCISRIHIDTLECYRQVIKYFLDNNGVIDEGKSGYKGIRLSSVLRELYPENNNNSTKIKKLQVRIIRERDQNQRPRIFTPVVAGVLERAEIRARHKIPGMYRLTNRKKAETYVGFLNEIIEFYNVINTKK